MIRCPSCFKPHEARTSDELRIELGHITLRALSKSEDEAREYMRVQLKAIVGEIEGGCLSCCALLAFTAARVVADAEAQLQAVSDPHVCTVIPFRPIAKDARFIGTIFDNVRK